MTNYPIGTPVAWTDGTGCARSGIVVVGVVSGRQVVRDDRNGNILHPRTIKQNTVDICTGVRVE